MGVSLDLRLPCRHRQQPLPCDDLPCSADHHTKRTKAFNRRLWHIVQHQACRTVLSQLPPVAAHEPVQDFFLPVFGLRAFREVAKLVGCPEVVPLVQLLSSVDLASAPQL